MTEQETVKTEEVAKVNPLERTLDLVVSYASAEELTEKALKNYGKNAKLPGFRKGSRSGRSGPPHVRHAGL